MAIVNPELFMLAKQALAAQAALFEKVSVVPPGGGIDPAAAAQGAVPPADPMQAAMGAAPPAGGAPPAPPAAPGGMMDPSMLGALPPAQPQAPAPAAGQQKLKPEQMMQMLDYRLYNMQQQLTAIMNAMGVQVPPESLVLPPGTTGAPPAETALPGGPMAPPPPQAAPQDPAAAGAAPPADPAKQAEWRDVVEEYAASRIGTPISRALESAEEPISLQMKAAAVSALRRSLEENVG
jgi:hypothetical protein